jgi:UDP-3-O-[3-hydroxymyristoyl] N-acetylglucosamine deacetylase
MDKSDAAPSPAVPQRTLKNAIHCAGVGRCSGARIAMTLRPAPPDLGIVFSRVDLGHRPWITASWEHATVDDAATRLVNESGVEVAGIAPLMSALCGCGIDNAMIELDGPEVPAMDGSAAPFVFLLECAGLADQTAARRAMQILKPIQVLDDKGSIALSPGPGLTFDIRCASDCPAIGEQVWSVTLDRQSYKRELSRARHFDFLEPAEGADGEEHSPDNAVTVLGDRIADERPLRYENEFVRHQAQCLLGDLYLAGGPVLGHATARNASRTLMLSLLGKLFSTADAWSWSEFSKGEPAQSAEPPESPQQQAAVGA